MISFLEEYKRLKDKRFFEECFAYGVYDLINDQPEFSNSHYNLKKIAEEAFLINPDEREITKKTLKEVIDNFDIKFVNEIRRYFVVFYKSGKTG